MLNNKVEKKYRLSDGVKELIYTYHYNENGKMVYEIDNVGRHYWYKYDDHGNVIEMKDQEGYTWNWKYEYDEDGNKVHEIDGNDDEYIYEYSDK